MTVGDDPLLLSTIQFSPKVDHIDPLQLTSSLRIQTGTPTWRLFSVWWRQQLLCDLGTNNTSSTPKCNNYGTPRWQHKSSIQKMKVQWVYSPRLTPYSALREACSRTDKGHILQAPLVGHKVTHWMGGITIIHGYHNTVVVSCIPPADTKHHLHRHLYPCGPVTPLEWVCA